MIITIWRKRTHNLICGPSSFLAATPPRREHLQLLLKTKNSAWADFLCNKMWEKLKRSSRSIVKQCCSIVLPTLSQPGGKHNQYLLCFLLGHFGQGGRTGKGLKEKSKKGVEQNNSWWLLVMHVRNEKARNLKALTWLYVRLLFLLMLKEADLGRGRSSEETCSKRR